MGSQAAPVARSMETLRKKSAKRSQKRAEKKNELAQSALLALSQLGYARAGLRDIAALSGVSLGVIHYYFEDKNQLVSYAIHLYKQQFVAELTEALSGMQARTDVIATIIARLEATIEAHAEMHRLWYDFRAQAMFEEAFQKDICEIEQALVALLAQMMGGDDDPTREDALQLYIAVDGVFRYYLHRKLMGQADWRAGFARALRNVLECGMGLRG